MDTPATRIHQWFANTGQASRADTQAVEIAIAILVGSGCGYEEIVEMSDAQISTIIQKVGLRQLKEMALTLDQATSHTLTDPEWIAILQQLHESIHRSIGRAPSE